MFTKLTKLNMLSNEELFLQIKQGSKTDFKVLYERNWLSLYNVAFKRLKDPETCRDLVQDIFADLWDKREQKDIVAVLPYLHSAVRYKIYTLLSKGKAMPHFVEPFENMFVSHLNADSYFNEKELFNLLHLWMETLPLKRREIFRLKMIEQKSTLEISKELNISQKTVQNQLLLAFQNLKLHFRQYLSLIILILLKP